MASEVPRLKPSLLEYLVCPADGQELELRDSAVEAAEIVAGGLVCRAGHRYPISGGIPRLLPPTSLTDQAQKTRDSFSAKWRLRLTALSSTPFRPWAVKAPWRVGGTISRGW